MHEPVGGLNRRTIVWRGLAALAGLVGLEVIERRPQAQAEADPVPPSGRQILRFHARRWRGHVHGQTPGEIPVSSGRLNRHGELYGVVDGRRVGEYFGTSFSPASTFGALSGTATGVELHTFKLGSDSLFGMGTVEVGSAPQQSCAIVGGTGRFTGARGAYVIYSGGKKFGRDLAEIIITIVS